MQSPLEAIMGLAGGAAGMIQKVFNRGSPDSGFDEQLQTALAGPTGEDKTLLDKTVTAKDSDNDDSLNALPANPQVSPLFQYLSLMKSLGLNSADIKALLLGKGAEISDDGIKAILKSCGVADADITQLMTDPKLVAGLKDKLAETMSTKVHQQLGNNLPDLDNMIEQLTVDQTTFDAAVDEFIACSGFYQVPDLSKSSLALQNKEVPAGLTQISSKTKAIPEIQGAVKAFLNEPESAIAEKGGPAFREMLKAEVKTAVSDAAPQTMPEIQEAVGAIENTFNIPKKTLQVLFVSTDPQERQAALDDAASHITEYLKANGGKDLPKQVTGALSLLKGILSKDEFAKVEDVFKAVNPDFVLTAQPFTFGRNVLNALAKAFGDETVFTQNRYTDSVMDQMKQAITANVKASSGSMSLELHPPMLGRVDVDIKLQDGQIMALFKTDQPLTRDILQQNMHILKDALTDQGIKATQFVVTTDTFDSRDHHHNPLAWAGYEPGRNGSSGHQGNQGETGDPGRSRDDYFNGYAPVQGYSEQGGLDIFA